MEYLVDVQGFKKPHNEFVYKEVAIVPLEADTQPTVLLFAPPYNWSLLPTRYKSENTWLERNFLGISWNDGDIPYDEVDETLKSHLKNASRIYVKGIEKQKWLSRLKPNIVKNLGDFEGCPSVRKQPSSVACSHHEVSFLMTYNCAVKNVIFLKEWLLEYLKTPLFHIYKEPDNVYGYDGYDEVDKETCQNR